MHSSALILAIAAGAVAAPLNTRQIGSLDDDSNQLTNGRELGDDGIVSNILAIPESIIGGNTKGRKPNAIAAPTLPKRQLPGGLNGASDAEGIVAEALAIPAEILGGRVGSNSFATGLPGLGKRQDVDGLTGVVGELLGGKGGDVTSDVKRRQFNDDALEHPETEGAIPSVIDAFLGSQQYEDDDTTDALTRRQIVDDDQGLVEDVIDVLENKNPVGAQTLDRNTGLPARQIVDDDQGLAEDIIDILENKNPVGPQQLNRASGLPARQVIPGEQGIAEDVIDFLTKNKDAAADRPVVFESLPANRNTARQVGQLAGQAAGHHDNFIENIADALIETQEQSSHDVVSDRLPNGILKRQFQIVKDQGIVNDIEDILVESNEPKDGTTLPGSIAGAAGNTGATRPAFPNVVNRQVSQVPGGQQFEDYVSGEGLLDLPEEIVKSFTTVQADQDGLNVPSVNNNGATVPIGKSNNNRRQIGGSFLAPLTNLLKPFQSAVQGKVPAIPGSPVPGVPSVVN